MQGQQELRAASVLVIGAGGLGSPVLLYLAAAGIGSLTIIDDDVVDSSNLQRQVIHRDSDVGRPKVDSARDAVLRLDPELRVTTVNDRLTPDNALELFRAHDVVIDGADNFATRYLSNDAAELTGTPLIWGTIFRFEGQVSTFVRGQGPTLRDLFPDMPDADSVPSCAEGGVLGVLCGTIGAAMATEAIKIISGVGRPLIGRLLRYDALNCDYSTLRFSLDPDRPPVTNLAEAAEEISVDELHALGPSAVILDVRESWEREIRMIPESIHVPLAVVRAEGWPAIAQKIGASEGSPGEMVVHCAAGIRSAEAVRLLLDSAPAGWRLRSLSGGINAWTDSPDHPG